jgi:hypothetical protein
VRSDDRQSRTGGIQMRFDKSLCYATGNYDSVAIDFCRSHWWTTTHGSTRSWWVGSNPTGWQDESFCWTETWANYWRRRGL